MHLAVECERPVNCEKTGTRENRDLWPVAHLWLAWALLAIGMSVVEILIITTLFIWFLAEPEWSIWRTNWFVNKVFVLAAFVLVLSTALFRPESLKARSS